MRTRTMIGGGAEEEGGEYECGVALEDEGSEYEGGAPPTTATAGGVEGNKGAWDGCI